MYVMKAFVGYFLFSGCKLEPVVCFLAVPKLAEDSTGYRIFKGNNSKISGENVILYCRIAELPNYIQNLAPLPPPPKTWHLPRTKIFKVRPFYAFQRRLHINLSKHPYAPGRLPQFSIFRPTPTSGLKCPKAFWGGVDARLVKTHLEIASDF